MLKLRRVPISYCQNNIVFLNAKNDFFRSRDASAITKVEVHGGAKPLYGVAAVCNKDSIVKPDELGLSENAFMEIDLPEGTEVSLIPATKPASLNSIRRKMKGGVLSTKEYKAIMSDIASGKYSKLEVAALEVACSSFITPQEVFFMSEAVIGGKAPMKWRRDIVVDEVSIGGVPGNRVSPIVTAIVIGAGMCMPKITYSTTKECSSTLDVMATLCETDIDEETLRAIVDNLGGGIAGGTGRIKLSTVNDVLTEVEDALGMGIPQQMVVSVMSHSILAGVTHLVVDIPVGSSTIVRTMGEGMRLKKLFEYVGDMLGLDANVVITDGTEPIGKGIGPVLESRDVMNVLRCAEEAPRELREKALFIAGRVLEFDPKLRGGHGYYRAQEILDSGRALEVMNRIIHTQGKLNPSPLGQLTRDITATASGTIDAIDGMQINRIATMAGAPSDKGAGVDIFKRVGDKVEQGETLYRIHAIQPMAFAFAGGLAEGNSGFRISNDVTANYG